MFVGLVCCFLDKLYFLVSEYVSSDDLFVYIWKVCWFDGVYWFLYFRWGKCKRCHNLLVLTNVLFQMIGFMFFRLSVMTVVIRKDLLTWYCWFLCELFINYHKSYIFIIYISWRLWWKFRVFTISLLWYLDHWLDLFLVIRLKSIAWTSGTTGILFYFVSLSSL